MGTMGAVPAHEVSQRHHRRPIADLPAQPAQVKGHYAFYPSKNRSSWLAGEVQHLQQLQAPFPWARDGHELDAMNVGMEMEVGVEGECVQSRRLA